MMKILMTCHDVQIDRRIISQAKELLNLGHQVCIMALSKDEKTFFEKDTPSFKIYRIGFKDVLGSHFSFTHYFNFSFEQQKIILKYVRGYFLLNALLYRFFSSIKYEQLFFSAFIPFTKPFYQLGRVFDYDIVQCHDLPTLEAAYFLAKAKNTPLVYDAHEFYPEQHVFSGQKKEVYRRIEKRLIQKCDLVFTVNQSIAQKMAGAYEISEPLTLINALDAPKYPIGNSNIIKEKLNLTKDKKVLLFQGMFSPNRQLDILLEAMNSVKNPNIILVLMGQGELKHVLYKKAQDLGLLNERVYFLDAVPQDELLMYSASADMGIIPYPHIDLNSYYCTPNKLFEFIQAKLPIIANDSPELRRFIHDEGFGQVYPMNNPKEIAHAIDLGFEGLQNEQWQDNLNLKAELFSWQAIKSIYINAMQKVIESRHKEAHRCVV